MNCSVLDCYTSVREGGWASVLVRHTFTILTATVVLFQYILKKIGFSHLLLLKASYSFFEGAMSVNFHFHLFLTAFELFMHWNPESQWTYIVSIT